MTSSNPTYQDSMTLFPLVPWPNQFAPHETTTPSFSSPLYQPPQPAEPALMIPADEHCVPSEQDTVQRQMLLLLE
jgi:hypothetical protein